MEGRELVNPNPEIKSAATADRLRRTAIEQVQETNDEAPDAVDSLEIFELIKNIMDPEHPNTLEQLGVVDPENIFVDAGKHSVRVLFTPTVPHCSMTTLIGLCIRVKLQRCISNVFKIDVKVAPGTHNQEVEVNKQLADKERVAAALESKGLLELVHKCLNEFD